MILKMQDTFLTYVEHKNSGAWKVKKKSFSMLKISNLNLEAMKKQTF